MAKHRDNRTADTPKGYEGKHRKDQPNPRPGALSRQDRLDQNPDGWFVER